MEFKLKAPYSPTGDQPQAIEKLTKGIKDGLPHQVLLGVTGSGKTYTIANVIKNVQKPTLVISHNKTLAAQLYQEFREFFPKNGVGFFISYYDYYLPESYIPQTDTYIAKETDVNEEIDRLRLEATSLLSSRKDVVIVASVSCIYNIGSPTEYSRKILELKVGQKISQRELAKDLVDLFYENNRWEVGRGVFRRRGDLIEIGLAYKEEILEVEFSGDKIIGLSLKKLFSDQKIEEQSFFVCPAKHYIADPGVLGQAFVQIEKDLNKRLAELKKEDKLLEAQRLEQRVNYDLEMIHEVGYVSGIENYSRYFDNRDPGDPPNTLIDFYKHAFGDDFLVVIDESHITVPQVGGMYLGDKSRKQTLIDFGFRLPACLDNRPLQLPEFLNLVPKTIYVSATPAEWEIKKSDYRVVEQLVRPTGLTEPEVVVRPTGNQVQDLIQEILKRKKKKQRVLVTTLTKRLAEDLSVYLSDTKNTQGKKIAVHYIHADVAALERVKILADLRRGKYDVIVGVNLLREGLDLPEVSLVAILDADSRGFLRSKTSLIQTMGRATRNSAGEVILYADEKTNAIVEAIAEVERRRRIQLDYNKKYKITPKTIEKPIRKGIVKGGFKKNKLGKRGLFSNPESMTPKDISFEIRVLKRKMGELAAALEFEAAVKVRDQIRKMEDWLD
ncbi:MAG: excinuclease ABC subunit UvrB [Patescibacteria group bacterium]|nr:excinuclease ABC subunit UvrB [Patescibacteria group bacterium]